MVESGYVYNSATMSLEHYYQEPADYDWSTSGSKEICLEGLSDCKFSYSDGQSWETTWGESKGDTPRAIKINFKFQGEDKDREFVVNVPISP